MSFLGFMVFIKIRRMSPGPETCTDYANTPKIHLEPSCSAWTKPPCRPQLKYEPAHKLLVKRYLLWYRPLPLGGNYKPINHMFYVKMKHGSIIKSTLYLYCKSSLDCKPSLIRAVALRMLPQVQYNALRTFGDPMKLLFLLEFIYGDQTRRMFTLHAFRDGSKSPIQRETHGVGLMGPKPSWVETAPGEVIAACCSRLLSRSLFYAYSPACLIRLPTPSAAFLF